MQIHDLCSGTQDPWNQGRVTYLASELFWQWNMQKRRTEEEERCAYNGAALAVSWSLKVNLGANVYLITVVKVPYCSRLMHRNGISVIYLNSINELITVLCKILNKEHHDACRG